MQERIYAAGRDLGHWVRGAKVTSLEQVPAGTPLIAVSHPFQAENLIKVVPYETLLSGFAYHYMYPNGETRCEPTGLMFVHDFMLDGHGDEYFLAVEEPRLIGRSNGSYAEAGGN